MKVILLFLLKDKLKVHMKHREDEVLIVSTFPFH